MPSSGDPRSWASAPRRAGILTTTGLCLLLGAQTVHAQVRGVYPLGMSGTNSGLTPDPGFTYSNQFLYYARDEKRGPDGSVTATGHNSVLMDMNSFVWVWRKEILGGARFSMSATLPVANNSLSSDVTGAISGGGGFADSYYQPFILGWNKERLAVRAVYGFLAPTGRFSAGAADNVGSGYWTHAFSSGQTFFLNRSKATVLSTFEMYELHTEQEDTRIHPGQTMNLDYSLLQTFPLTSDARLQAGLVGYSQWQTTDKSGPGVTPEEANDHYRIHSLGAAGIVNLPERGVSLALKFFQEFGGRSTYQGYSVQISAVIGFPSK